MSTYDDSRARRESSRATRARITATYSPTRENRHEADIAEIAARGARRMARLRGAR